MNSVRTLGLWLVETIQYRVASSPSASDRAGRWGSFSQWQVSGSLGDVSVAPALGCLSIAGELHEHGRHSFCCLAALDG